MLSQHAGYFPVLCTPMLFQAFTGYIGEDTSKWAEWDPSLQLNALGDDDVPNLLISQGTGDDFLLNGQLLTDSLPEHPRIDVRMEEGYDHSYYFIATFIEEHIDFHAKQLGVVQSSTKFHLYPPLGLIANNALR